MEFEEIFGVKVDLRIPDLDRGLLKEHWRRWLEDEPLGDDIGGIGKYTSLESPNLLSRYEHILIGSGVGIPPDPFKVLAAISRNADLDKVIEARRKRYPPESENRTYASFSPNFKEITGLEPLTHRLCLMRSDLDENGRIQFPRITAVVLQNGERVELSDKIISTIQLPVSEHRRLRTGTEIMEVFDYSNGYRIELVPK